MLKPSNTPVVILAGHCLRYYILLLLGFAIAWIASSVLGLGHFDSMMNFSFIWLFKGAVLLAIFCLVAIIYESIMGQ
jgi:hypothetical protein